MSNAIELAQDGESQVFTATRDARHSDHSNGMIREGERVFFRREAPQDGDGVVLLYESGEPTNGNQYLRFDTVADAQAFAKWAGLRAD